MKGGSMLIKKLHYRIFPPCYRRLTTSADYGKAILQYSEASSKSYIKIRGPDTPKFLNGLLTSKVIPFFIKKNLTTINPGEQEPINAVPQFDEDRDNWGIYNEQSYNGSYVSRFGQYSAILNSKGKLVTDTIVYPTPLFSSNEKEMKYPTYLLEFDNSIVEHILNVFNIHKLTSRVKLKKMNGIRSWDLSIRLPQGSKDAENAWIPNLLDPCTMTKTPKEALDFAGGVVSAFFQGNEDQVIAMYLERRTDEILATDGTAAQTFRVVTKSTVEDISQIFKPVGFPFEFEVEQKAPSFFRKLRFEAGFVDSTRDFRPETLLPLELNFDYLPNAVSADKGCYVGQELTARTFATGILRKRLVPVTLTNFGALPRLQAEKYYDILSSQKDETPSSSPSVSNPFGSKLMSKPRRQRPAGILIANEGDKGVALLRVEHFKKAFGNNKKEEIQFHIPIKDTSVAITPREPFWYHFHEEDVGE